MVPVEIREDDGPIVEPSFKAWWGVPDMPKVNFDSDGARQWALDVTKPVSYTHLTLPTTVFV